MLVFPFIDTNPYITSVFKVSILLYCADVSVKRLSVSFSVICNSKIFELRRSSRQIYPFFEVNTSFSLMFIFSHIQYNEGITRRKEVLV